MAGQHERFQVRFVSYCFVFLTMTSRQHDCFEKLEEPRGRCWPSGAPRYTRFQYQRRRDQIHEIANS